MVNGFFCWMGDSFPLKNLKFLLNSIFFFSRDFEKKNQKFLFLDCQKIWRKIVKKSFISWFIPKYKAQNSTVKEFKT